MALMSMSAKRGATDPSGGGNGKVPIGNRHRHIEFVESIVSEIGGVEIVNRDILHRADC